MFESRTLTELIVITDYRAMGLEFVRRAHVLERSCTLSNNLAAFTAALDYPAIVLFGHDMAAALIEHANAFIPGWNGDLLPAQIGRWALVTRDDDPLREEISVARRKLRAARTLRFPLEGDDREWLFKAFDEHAPLPQA